MQHLTQIRSKILNHQQLIQQLSLWRSKKEAIVFTNGCFDLLHAGHIHTLAAAKDLGHRLIVGVNSDASTSRLKGPHRPINTAEQRTLLLAALLVVDAVVLFEEDTPLTLIEHITPDVLVKGGDYTVEQIVGSDWVIEHGGRVETIPFLAGYSTTSIESRLKRTK